MTSIVDHLLNVRGVPVYLIVGLLVFAEDALFVGFVIPGETAAVLGGVIASRGHVHYPLIAAVAVFLGRFVAFFRAVMPALAGTSRMRYPRFLAYNAAGGLIWGIGFTLLGYLAGNSYATVEKTVGRTAALAVLTLILLALLIWRLRRRQTERHAERTAERPTPNRIRPGEEA